MSNKEIPGIYNYCDRWCERCSFTLQCLTYKFCKIIDDNIDDKIKFNKAFVSFLNENLEKTLELFDESEFEEEYYLADEDYAEDDLEIKRLIAENKNVAQLAMEYSNIVSKWFDKNEVMLIVNSIVDEKNKTKINNSIEVIHWYHIFIHSKIMRALQCKEEDLSEEEFPLDSDGFAKIVLIAIDYSISAWGYIYMQMDDKEEYIFNIIKLLVSLQHLVEEEFPNARSFIRPGFDEKDLKE